MKEGDSMFYDKMTKHQLIEEIIKKEQEIAELKLMNNVGTIPSCVKSLKENQLALMNHQSVLNSILEASKDGILVVDNYGRIIHRNEQFIDLFEIPGEYLQEEYSLKLADILKERLIQPDKYIENIVSIIDKPEDRVDILHFKNGRIVERLFTPLNIGNEHKGRVWIFRDVTARMHLESELKRSERLYSKLIELLPIGIILYKGNKVAIINSAGARLFGFANPEDLIGKEFGSLAGGNCYYSNTVMEKVRKLQHCEMVMEPEVQNIFLKSGENVYVEISGFSFKYEDELVFTLIVRDITEHKKIEELNENIRLKDVLLKEAKEYNQLKTQLFSTISHELKTPLNIILAVAQLMQKFHNSGYNCPYQEYFEKHMRILKQNSFRLLRLINNIVDVSRIEMGFLKMNLSKSDIINLVEDISLSVVEYTKSKGIYLVFDTQIEEKIMVYDAEKVERVMLNLLSNAIKFTEPGGKINVNVYEREGAVLISVKDTGIGIPENMLEKIFDPFRQVDSSLRRNSEGSGIGLSLVKSLVQMHGGTITVRSRYGQGSEFIVELPDNLACDEACTSGKTVEVSDSNVERINIEFSDIYL